MSVPLTCPSCGECHLHAGAYISAEPGDRYEVVAGDAAAERVTLRENTGGRIERPTEVHLQCCACDWEGDAVVDGAT